jgi:hypothetical protein
VLVVREVAGVEDPADELLDHGVSLHVYAGRAV